MLWVMVKMPLLVCFERSTVVMIFLVVQSALSISIASDNGINESTTEATTPGTNHSPSSPEFSHIYQTGFTTEFLTTASSRPLPQNDTVNEEELTSNTKEYISTDATTPNTSRKTHSTLLLNVTFPFCEESECGIGSHCVCDSVCYYFSDCCHTQIQKDYSDAAARNFDTSLSDLLHFKRKTAEEELNIYYDGRLQQFACVAETDGSYGYWMIDKCPLSSHASPLTVKKCEEPTGYNYNSIPMDMVTDSGKYLVTFKNVHCALCTMKKLNNFQFWNVQVDCPVAFDGIITAETSLTDIERDCNIVYLPWYSKIIRACNPVVETFENHLSSTNWDQNENLYKDLYQLCKSYIMPVSNNASGNSSDTYRNPHCAIIHNVSNIDDFTCFHIDRSGNNRNGTESEGSKLLNTINLRILFDFDAKSGIEIVSMCQQLVECEIYEVFDCVTSRCRRLYCQAFYTPYLGKCVPSNDNKTYIQTSVAPFDTSQYATQNDDTYIVITLLRPKAWVLRSEIRELIYLVNYTFGSNLIEGSVIILNSTTESELRSFVVMVDVDFITAQSVAKKFYETVMNVTGSVVIQTFETVESLTCDNSKDYFMITEHDVQHNYRDIDNLYFSSINMTVAIQHARWQLTKTKLDANLTLAITCIDIGQLINLDCPFVEVNSSNTESKGNSLLLSGRLIGPDEYVRFQNSIYVCSVTLGPTWAYVNVFEYLPEYIELTYITSSVSIICLLSIMVVNIIDKKHMNIHSLNISALSLTIMLMHVMIVIQTFIIGQIACIVYAVVLHFLVLNMFAWMGVIAFDMARVFASQISITDIKPFRKFLKYVSVSVLFPMTVIIPGLSLEFSPILTDDSSLIKPGYGEHEVCWVSNGTSLVVYVMLPVGLSIMATFILFTISIVSMCKQRVVTKQVGKMTLRDYLFVYLKLVFILGFTWMLGIISAVSHQEWLWVLHVILNGLQGLSLFICSVVNKRAVRRLRKYIDSAATSTTRSDHVQ